MDYSDSYGYQGTSNGEYKTRYYKKDKITYSDIMAKTDLTGLKEQ